MFEIKKDEVRPVLFILCLIVIPIVSLIYYSNTITSWPEAIFAYFYWWVAIVIVIALIMADRKYKETETC